ncbi:hypothetical protein LOC71_17065 [Rhodopirellula sp. JC740]|uniref:Uncharacterized protein n=1 Tax=Rhodopirellula halodulae TaxID=2894198 RepID=A0ABS8NKA9_9BACT|nr:hypothetical protein [Rhodopirellula sp. JC740]MCC9643996.1 hypothetical protein [Rhodopirellula sp. JC740]
MVDRSSNQDAGHHLDLVHEVQPAPEESSRAADSAAAQGTPGNPRPFLGIQFRCCQTYGRIYRNDERTAYRGGCPKCGSRVEVPIGNGGTNQRFFSAG